MVDNWRKVARIWELGVGDIVGGPEVFMNDIL